MHHPPAACPSCLNPMQVHVLEGVRTGQGGSVTLDLCFACQGLWIDPGENLRLAPAAVAELFRLLHQHRDAQRLPLAHKLACTRCETALTQGFDVVKSGRYITYRCGKGHGRFSPFSSFMIEKGFVRPLRKHEVDDIARALGVIHCSSCGAPVDLRKDHICPHCRSAFSLLDPQAVEKALHGYAQASALAHTPRPHDLADALVQLERDRAQARRVQTAPRGGLLSADVRDAGGADLLAVGLALVGALLN